jgi:hypothetical protein
VRRRLAQLKAWSTSPKVVLAVRLGIISMGLTTLHAFVKEHEERLVALEDRGLAPLDDLVTIRDLDKVELRLGALEEGTVQPEGSPLNHAALARLGRTDLPAGSDDAGQEGSRVQELE